jgi:hypothetical protein
VLNLDRYEMKFNISYTSEEVGRFELFGAATIISAALIVG